MVEVECKTMDMAARKARVAALVDIFGRDLDYYKSRAFVESECRSKFIDPFLECLGWDVRNQKGARHNRLEVITEDRLAVGDAVRRPDYTLCYGGQRVMFVEAKQPSVPLKIDPAPAFQVRRYAYTARMPIAVLTDFEELALYDGRVKPKRGDSAATARVAYYTFREYEARFEELYHRLSWQAVDLGEFDAFAAESEQKRGTAAVDVDILKTIEQWRAALAEAIALKNGEVDAFNLTGCVQKLIDRILFLRICEDKGIEPERQLWNAVMGREMGVRVYGLLQTLFAAADARYNAGLFARDAYLDGLTVPDKVLVDIVRALYYPECQYEFSVLPVEILGSIYERFLGKTIRYNRRTKYGHSVSVEEKPEVQKAGGVYYTPAYIVRYIVEQTLGAKLLGCTLEGAAGLRVVDPACGSGSFLVGAYQYLLDWHLDYYTQPENVEGAERGDAICSAPRGGGYKLTLAEKRRILRANIFGVDIDAQAVEVTKLSLALKLLEDEGHSLGAEGQRVLPDLSENIRCGNALVGSEFYRGKDLAAITLEAQRAMNAFDWRAAFAEVFDEGGFDCVIGNPPYVSAPNQVELFPEQRQGIIEGGRFNTLYQKWDLYVPFVELGLQLLKEEGLYAQIIPYPFTNQLYAMPLRRMVLEDYDLLQMVDLRGEKVFAGATVSNCIPVVRRSRREGVVRIARQRAREKIAVVGARGREELPLDGKSYVWHLGDDAPDAARHEGMLTLGDLCYISKGMVLNADERTAKGKFRKGDLVRDAQDDVHCRAYVEAKDIGRYTVRRVRYLEYDTERVPGQLSRPTFRELYERDKLIVNRLGEMQVMLDEGIHYLQSDSSFCVVLWRDLKGVENSSIGNSVAKFCRFPRSEMEELSEGVSLKYLLAILNSSYAARLLGRLRGGDYHIYPAHLRGIPIPHASAEERAQLERLAEQMLEVQRRLQRQISAADRQLLEQRAELLEGQIDGAVERLYGAGD